MELFINSFKNLPDFRLKRTQLHDLLDVVFISVCGVICGCDDYMSIKYWADDNVTWLKQYINLSNGVPSDDTFRRIFQHLDYQAFNQCFMDYTQGLSQFTQGEVICFDGKCLCGSKNKKLGQKGLYMLGAWASSNKLLLGQMKVGEKTNEIRVMPQLLDILVLKGCIVTADALNCQKEIAEKIIAKEADYVLALKGNQGTLHQDIISSFENKTPNETYTKLDKDHGRIEKRVCEIIYDLDLIRSKDAWKNLAAIVKITSERMVVWENKMSTEIRYFITNQCFTAEKTLNAVRLHWGIENELHWCLDVSFNEDKHRNRVDNSAINFSFLQRITLNLIKKEPTKMSIAHKRHKAHRDKEFLEKILNPK
jgi:predicted transposase YbfD/YdcC